MFITDAGIGVDASLSGAVSVYFDGRRVWTSLPSRDGKRQPGGERLVPWPESLVRFLSGTSEICVREVDTDEELFRDEVSLRGGRARISVVDSAGEPLTVDKRGRLLRTFEAHGVDDRRGLVQATQRALDILSSMGVPAFLSFGCLLGAVRDGQLIGHDNDADISYVARSTHPFDVIHQSFALERHFRDLGWISSRLSACDFKLWAPLPSGSLGEIDVFTAFYKGDLLYLSPCVRGAIPLSSLMPQSTVQLEGQLVTAPADPEALLEATYGPGWRIPDPSFKYTPGREIRRVLGLIRGERTYKAYWDRFYNEKAEAVSQDPSAFARWVAEREPGRGDLIDIGSGTGRDALWFSDLGFPTLGCDYARAAVNYARAKAQQRGLSAEFAVLNLYDLRHVLVRGAQFAHERTTEIVYARFMVHAIEDAGRHNLWLVSRSALRGRRGRLYLEFRTEKTEHEFGEHFRQFVQPDVVVEELEAHGFDVEHCEEGYGLATYKTEDPRVCRIVARAAGRLQCQ